MANTIDEEAERSPTRNDSFVDYHYRIRSKADLVTE